jgi:NAD(P)-dependent dehydrogenase (short-subunit alcohol dehydrogenase family)
MTTTATSIALVTGANKGIGFEVARQLGQRGSTVLVGARDPGRGAAAERALRDEGLDVHHLPLDVTDEASIAAAAKQVEADHGRLDILVNNAGIAGVALSGLPSETPLDAFRTLFETNVVGVVAVTNAFLPLLRRSPAGRIVNVSSELGSITAALDRESPCWPLVSIPYPVSKTALNMVTAMYAKELDGTPVKVNTANPGYCATDLNGHSGFRTAAQGAEPIVHLATLPDDGPTGTFYGHVWVNDPTPETPEYAPLAW